MTERLTAEQRAEMRIDLDEQSPEMPWGMVKNFEALLDSLDAAEAELTETRTELGEMAAAGPGRDGGAGARTLPR